MQLQRGAVGRGRVEHLLVAVREQRAFLVLDLRRAVAGSQQGGAAGRRLLDGDCHVNIADQARRQAFVQGLSEGCAFEKEERRARARERVVCVPKLVQATDILGGGPVEDLLQHFFDVRRQRFIQPASKMIETGAMLLRCTRGNTSDQGMEPAAGGLWGAHAVANSRYMAS